jgi:hypothetical protein
LQSIRHDVGLLKASVAGPWAVIERPAIHDLTFSAVAAESLSADTAVA